MFLLPMLVVSETACLRVMDILPLADREAHGIRRTQLSQNALLLIPEVGVGRHGQPRYKGEKRGSNVDEEGETRIVLPMS